VKKLLIEFPNKGWGLHGLNKLLKKLRYTSMTVRRSGTAAVYGRHRTAQ